MLSPSSRGFVEIQRPTTAPDAESVLKFVLPLIWKSKWLIAAAAVLAAAVTFALTASSGIEIWSGRAILTVGTGSRQRFHRPEKRTGDRANRNAATNGRAALRSGLQGADRQAGGVRAGDGVDFKIDGYIQPARNRCWTRSVTSQSSYPPVRPPTSSRRFVRLPRRSARCMPRSFDRQLEVGAKQNRR